MPLVLLVVIALLLLVNAGVIGFLWWRTSNLSSLSHFLEAAVQRQEREITQLRYGIAMLRQLHKGDAVTVSDEDRLKTAVDNLDNVAEGAAGDAGGPVVSDTQADVAVGGLKEDEILSFVKKAIKNNQIAVSKQPIVDMPKRQVRYYEIFSRIQVGDKGFIPAHEFVSIARTNNLMGRLDNLLLLRCLQMIKNSGDEQGSVGYFLNVSVTTLSNKAYIDDLTEFLAANPKLSSRIIFEMTQEDTMKITPTTRSVMDGLALLGCRFSMDQVKLFGMDMARLADNNISFVKMDGRAVAKEIDNGKGKDRMKRIKNQLESQGIDVIVDKIETKTQILDLVGIHVNYGQGYFFGQPQILA